jgi:predicted metal-dependent hydrolase
VTGPKSGTTVMQGGRPKAYRPLPEADRRAAFEAGLAAYDRGDFFEAHELLEPAWMGTADPVERDLHQGLIKLSAAFVHDVRGNPLGIIRNLTGARARLAAARDAVTAGARPAVGAEVDAAPLVDDVDARLAALAADPTASVTPPRIERIERTRGR